MTSVDILGRVSDTDQARPGLPRTAYLSPEIFERERELVLSTQWFFAGHVSSIPNTGDYFERHIGPESLIICRDDAGGVRAFFNVCRHRGFRLVEDRDSGCARLIVCPYHKWTFQLDGKLRGVPGSRDGQHFDFAEYGLHEAKCGVWHGWIWVCVGDNPPDLKTYLDSQGDVAAIAKASAGGLKLAHRKIYTAEANWKSVLENETECYHCAHGHPMLAAVSNYRTLYADEYNGEFFALYEGKKTFSTDGELVSTRLAPDLPDGFNAGVFTGPMFCGLVLFADHAVATIATPLSVNQTQMICEWYVSADAEEGKDYDVAWLTEIFDQTNREDVAFAERNYRGIQSIRHVPGPVHPTREAIVRQALDSYLDLMGQA
jgi:Rieske 2Fe-2S family protein